MKIFQVVFILIISLPLIAQDQIKQKLTKNDRILQAAYDDSTRALAQLFLVKRKSCREMLKVSNTTSGIGIVVAAGGIVILENDMNQGPGGPFNPVNYRGFGLMAMGVTVALSSGIVTGVALVKKNPYTVKKYRILVDWHKAGKPWPDFYMKRVAPYL